ncbi:carbon dioxide concentrating mechanism protein CcmL [Geitlerinema sp. P-1104]|uniref:EutN/CcmL family microcompartment protein n=1 Tax=Geitlerinema sp. P-1104 TaxID=2546230 RepID=UPI00147711A5|nr:EutN/CcmL family microcompartment protein [Geitlerinema sp. P-1104]NMG57733.1 carbon dioxide concentrating mechanism protein CcmL [Geitlerinema sp. P-1104]
MQIARVCGTVVSTQKLDKMRGLKLLVLQLVDAEGELLPDYEVAADLVGAGVGEWVLFSRGSAARVEPGREGCPIDALTVGIIDTVSLENRQVYNKKDRY